MNTHAYEHSRLQKHQIQVAEAGLLAYSRRSHAIGPGNIQQTLCKEKHSCVAHSVPQYINRAGHP